ncbi:MAG: hypothetical protein N2C14_10395, partial [Planctomycetales bacterium]
LGFAMAGREDAITMLRVKGKGLAGQPRIQRSLGDLPKDPIGVMLLDPMGMFRMLNNFGAGAIPGLPVALPKTAPAPFAASLSADKEGYGAHVAVRAETVKEIVGVSKSLAPPPPMERQPMERQPMER